MPRKIISKTKKVLAKSIDTRDRVKIRKRTRPASGDFPYRLHFVNETPGERITFLALGDAGAGNSRKRPKFLVADEMAREPDAELILHLGDVIYLSGSADGYEDRFIKPYHHWLKDGTRHRYDDLVFTTPFLPVYGNHDYYDMRKAVPLLGDFLAEISSEIGEGSGNGRVFEKAFVELDDDRKQDGRLDYVTGSHTRLPNRYYWFTYGPCAFFALDSNTLDGVKNPDHGRRDEMRAQRKEARKLTRRYKKQLRFYRETVELKPLDDEQKELFAGAINLILDELAEEEKKIAMLDKYLDAREADYDAAQLAWFEQVLQHPDVQDKWKIAFFHHPLYSSDGSHTDDIESIGLRENLRERLVEGGVHLVLNGHSHCFEWLQRAASEGGPTPLEAREQRICYLVSGGGGRNLRLSILEEDVAQDRIAKKRNQFLDVAESKAYTALFLKPGAETMRGFNPMYHYLRVEATEETLTVTPVGVLPGEDGQASRRSPLRTKVFTRTPDGIAVEQKHLARIHVFRDAEPQAEWDE